MKQFTLTALFLIFGAFFLSQPSYAMIEPHNGQSTATIEKQKNDLKKEFKAEKRMAKFEKLFKKAIDLKDPVNKWMWFWIFGWGASIVLLALPGVWILSSLAGLFGTVSLVIWLVKKFA
jgi:hypothetical protein